MVCSQLVVNSLITPFLYITINDFASKMFTTIQLPVNYLLKDTQLTSSRDLLTYLCSTRVSLTLS